MTTNKPDVKRYTPAYGVDSVMRGHLFMEECDHGAWVPLEDYEALHSECEDLRAALAESRANDQQAMAYLSEVRAIVGGDDFPDMVRRCEKLRAAIRL